MAGVRYEMSIISTFNGLRLQMLHQVLLRSIRANTRKELVSSNSVNRLVAEYLPHHVHTAPQLGKYSATVHRENGGYGDSEHFFQSSSVLPSLKLPRNFLPVLSGFEKFLFLT